MSIAAALILAATASSQAAAPVPEHATAQRRSVVATARAQATILRPATIRFSNAGDAPEPDQGNTTQIYRQQSKQGQRILVEFN